MNYYLFTHCFRLLASEEAVRAYGLKPLARVVAWNRVGCDPSIMGIGPGDLGYPPKALLHYYLLWEDI